MDQEHECKRASDPFGHINYPEDVDMMQLGEVWLHDRHSPSRFLVIPDYTILLMGSWDKV